MKNNYIKSSIIICLIPILTFILILGIYNTSITPIKNIIITLLISIIIFILSISLYLSNKETKYNIGQFIAISLNILLIYNIYIINNDYSYLKNIFNNEYKYLNNNVYALKSTKYVTKDNLKNKKIGILKYNNTNSKPMINKRIKDITIVEYNNEIELIDALYNGKIQCILINEHQEELLKNNNNKIIKESRKITELKIKENL